MTFSPAVDQDLPLVELQKRSQIILERTPDTRQWVTEQDSLDKIIAQSSSCIELFETACRLYHQRPALGIWREDLGDIHLPSPSREEARVPNHSIAAFTYHDLWQRIGFCAGGLKHELHCDAGDRVGILGFASADFLVAELACLYVGAVSIPLQAGASAQELAAIVREAAISCLFFSQDQWPSVCSLLKACPSIRHTIVMDAHTRDLIATKKEAATPSFLHHMVDLEKAGREAPPVAKFTPGPDVDPMITVMYTSGSTGSPKGAVLTHSMWFLRLLSVVKAGVQAPVVQLNYLPLNHLAGRLSCARALLVGGMTYFTRRSDLSTLFSDIQMTRPTQLLLVPRVSSLIYQHFTLEVLRRDGEMRQSEVPDGQKKETLLKDAVYREMRENFLGDRLLGLSVGTAPTPPHIMRFLQECFEVPVSVSYGSTEGSIIAGDHHILHEVVDAYRLVDVPDLGYFAHDKPFPRGELRVKSRQMVREYLNNPKATRDLLDDEGYLQTGDIVEERGPGHVVWIDRVKNVLKLSQGEFVTLWSLETLYSSQSPYVSQVYLYGNGSRSYLLAVLVPNPAAWGCPSKEAFRLLDEEQIHRQIKGELLRIAHENQLKPYEIPRDFIIETEPFTVANRLLTESSKLSRKNLQTKYGDLLETMYHQLEGKLLASIAAIKKNDGTMSNLEKLTLLIENSLNLKEPDLSLSFKELGGDSMAALEFAATVETVLNIKIPVGLILNPKGQMHDVVSYINRLEKGLDTSISVASIHGQNPSVLKASDLTLEKFFSPRELQLGQMVASENVSHSKSGKKILLTGANGFLGRFLAKDLASSLPVESGSVYCLVRATTEDQARERFLASFGTMDEALLLEVKKLLSQGRIKVLAGDLMQSRFGLSPSTYDQLADHVDTVVHNGALVNHVFPYEALFEPNVLGTVEVLRFALKSRLKKIAFISSVAAIHSPSEVSEDDDIRAKIPERPIKGGYANGYGVSKWASEVLLREAHDTFALPVAVFRCGMVLAARHGKGHINPDDLVSRLIWGLIHTGAAPQSFYRRNQGQIAAFSGLPVDFVSKAISHLARDINHSTLSTYHVVSPLSAKGGSLDDFVDWIASAGYPLERFPDHGTWYQSFVQRLESMDEKAKSRSPLTIAHQWQSPLESATSDIRGPFFWTQWGSIQKASAELAQDSSHLDKTYIHKCLSDLRALGLIPPPSRHR